MAFMINKTMENGITVNNAYAKIISAGTNKINANIRVAFYVNNQQVTPFYQHEYVFQPDMTDAGENLWKQGYEYLKTHSDFVGAVDVLEDGQHA